MEEEYRMQKAQAEIDQAIARTNGRSPGNEEVDAGHVVIHEDGSVRPRSASGHDDDASTRAMVSPTQTSFDTDANANAIPVIRVSSESGREERAAGGLGAHSQEEDISKSDIPPIEGNGELGGNGVATEKLEKPMQAAAGDTEQKEGDPTPSPEPFSFSNKRLCERWLDNLFMVLYEV
jgi:hypothetical protein